MTTAHWFLFLAFLTVQLAVSAYALCFGGAPERTVSTIMLAGVVGTTAMKQLWPSSFEGVQWGVLGVDLLMLAALVNVALLARRYWPLWVASFQLVAIVLHLMRLIDPVLMGAVYRTVQTLWAYPMMALLTAGTMRHRTRLSRLGTDPSWSSF